jgi:hypothetical protein
MMLGVRTQAGETMLRNQNITCIQCGSDAIPLRVDIIANADRPSEVVEFILHLRCANCGEQSQPLPPNNPPQVRHHGDP